MAGRGVLSISLKFAGSHGCCLQLRNEADIFVRVLSEAVLVRVLEGLLSIISSTSTRTSAIWTNIDVQ